MKKRRISYKKMFRNIIVLGCLLIITLLINGSLYPNNPTIYYYAADSFFENSLQQVNSMNPAPTKFLETKNSDVQKVKNKANEYAQKSMDLDYKTPMGQELRSLLADTFLKEKENKDKIINEIYKINQLVTKYDECSYTSIAFDNIKKHAIVFYTIKYHYVSANDAFFSKGKLKKNIVYQFPCKLKFIKDDDQWKIYDIYNSDVKETK